MKKLLSVILALAMIFSLSIPAFAADNDPVWSVEYDKNAKAVVITVDGETQKFTNWKNNQAEEYTVNGQIISVTVKGNAIDKKALIGSVAAPAEPLAATAEADSNSTPSNSQIVVNAETRIWQDGFGFHCNINGGNGATDVINLVDGKTVKKGDQKDVFGTKSFPITLVRVGTTTLWNLMTDEIECATCGSTEWVTYSNNSGVINGKNIQAHHPAYTLINKTWTDGNPNDKEAIFDIYKYDSQADDGRGALVVEGALPGEKYQLEPGTYVVSERVKEGYKVQEDQRLTVEEGRTTTFAFVNEPNDVEKFGTLSIQKTVNGVSFREWAIANELTDGEVFAIIGGMRFTAYLLDGENGNRVAGKEYPGDMDADGIITFGSELPIGWYEVEEEVSGTAVNYFVGDGNTKIFYVGEKGVSAEVVDIISSQANVGVIVSHDGTGVNWKLPDVWNGQLGGNADFQTLLAMGAQWIWDVEDTYQYGFTGSEIRLDFVVDVAEETTAPIYFAADNAAIIYVNGKLAAYTTVAFEGRGIPQTITDEDADVFFDSLFFGAFDGRWSEGWAHVYKDDITLTAGVNTITIFAANSASTDPVYTGSPATGTDNDSYNLVNNPCGLIFGFQLPGATFDNTGNIKKYGEASFTKSVVGDDEANLTQFAFELYKLGEIDEYDVQILNADEDDGCFKPDAGGFVYAGSLEPGFYVFKEVAQDGWMAGTYADGLYFEIRDNDEKAYWLNDDGEYVTMDVNPEFVNFKLGSIEVGADVELLEDWVSQTHETKYETASYDDSLSSFGELFSTNWFRVNKITDSTQIEIAQSGSGKNGIARLDSPYYYDVTIDDDTLTIAFDENFISASVLANVFESKPSNHNSGGHNSIKAGETLTFDISGKEEIWLEVHFEALSYYLTDNNGNRIPYCVIVGSDVGTRVYSGDYAPVITYSIDGGITKVADGKFENLASDTYTVEIYVDGEYYGELDLTVAPGETVTHTFDVEITVNEGDPVKLVICNRCSEWLQ